MTELMGPLAIKTTECLTQKEIVLEALNGGVVIADEHRRIFFANSQFMEMTGVPRASPDQICPFSFLLPRLGSSKQSDKTVNGHER